MIHVALLLTASALQTEPPVCTLAAGEAPLVIAKSCRVEIDDAAVADTDGEGAIRITGDYITVDFGGATLRGAQRDTPPDQCTGIGVVITGSFVTLKNSKIHGYKCGIRAIDADNLVIENCDVSDNFAQRLKSTSEAEDAGDWLWPHENDGHQWLENYGAGIYLQDTREATVRNCRARRTQNGLCVVNSDHARIYDNDFSFLSGWGIALYRSSRNTIAHNACDFCIRGYSHGVYSRGQDSAGILLFEQCSDNVIARNSATHSGDGLFGFAGNAALRDADKGGRGCNDNRIFENDFSYAAANGIEMTFSFDNDFVSNKLIGCNYGIWGGYSSRSVALGNEIAESEIAGIAVEHGSRWTIVFNTFRDNPIGIKLWWDEDEELLAKPWAKHNNTASRYYGIADNYFLSGRLGVELGRRTTDVVLARNVFVDSETLHATVAGTADFRRGAHLRTGMSMQEMLVLTRPPRDLPGESRPVGARKDLAGRKRIRMTEWGPVDWENPEAVGQVKARGKAGSSRSKPAPPD